MRLQPRIEQTRLNYRPRRGRLTRMMDVPLGIVGTLILWACTSNLLTPIVSATIFVVVLVAGLALGGVI